MEQLKQTEPMKVEVTKLVTVDPQISTRLEKFSQIYERQNERRNSNQAVFRILYYNWTLNKLIRKFRTGEGNS